MTDEQEKVFINIWQNMWPALSVVIAILSGGYFLVIDPLQHKFVELNTRIDNLEARLNIVEQEQWKRIGVIARFEELRSAYVTDFRELRESISKLTEKMIELHVYNGHKFEKK